MTSPYASQPERAFWKQTVAAENPLRGLYRRRFELTQKTAIATAGSCFAQHIGQNLRERGFNLLDAEPPPRGLRGARAKQFGYELFSARYGNVYTAAQLVQLIKEVYGKFAPEDSVWERSGRYFDALRPSVEPNGLDSPAEVLAQRQDHLKQLRWLFKSTEVFIFTLGLTEAWLHKASGTVFPMAPGVLAGEHDPEKYEFRNYAVADVYRDFKRFREIIRVVNPSIKFLLTVSPVPLTATASAEHVLTATTYSKAVLRAAAGQLSSDFADVDYFPSYEIVGTPFLGSFYEANKRSVRPDGVATVMRVFFEELASGIETAGPSASTIPEVVAPNDELVCEERLLEAFA